MKNLRKYPPNINKGMSDTWLKRFENTKNKKVVEKLFDYLEEKCLKESKKLDPLTEDLTINVFVVSRNHKNFFQVNLEKMVYNSEFDTWEGTEKYPVAIEVKIKDYYKNWDSMPEMIEDFLVTLPEKLDLALI